MDERGGGSGEAVSSRLDRSSETGSAGGLRRCAAYPGHPRAPARAVSGRRERGADPVAGAGPRQPLKLGVAGDPAGTGCRPLRRDAYIKRHAARDITVPRQSAVDAPSQVEYVAAPSDSRPRYAVACSCNSFRTHAGCTVMMYGTAGLPPGSLATDLDFPGVASAWCNLGGGRNRSYTLNRSHAAEGRSEFWRIGIHR